MRRAELSSSRPVAREGPLPETWLRSHPAHRQHTSSCTADSLLHLLSYLLHTASCTSGSRQHCPGSHPAHHQHTASCTSGSLLHLLSHLACIASYTSGSLRRPRRTASCTSGSRQRPGPHPAHRQHTASCTSGSLLHLL